MKSLPKPWYFLNVISEGDVVAMAHGRKARALLDDTTEGVPREEVEGAPTQDRMMGWESRRLSLRRLPVHIQFRSRFCVRIERPALAAYNSLADLDSISNGFHCSCTPG